jgi:hypothetical protein
MPPIEATSPTPGDVHSESPLRAESRGSAPERVQAEKISEAYSIVLYFGGIEKPVTLVTPATSPFGRITGS